MAEIFKVKNVSASTIELKTFGAIIASGETTELGSSDFATLSDELNAYLSGGTLVRLVSGVTTSYTDAYVQTPENLKVKDISVSGTNLPYANIDVDNGNKLVSSGDYYGQDYQRFQDLTSTSSNATSAAIKISGTTITLPLGTYKFTASCVWSRSATNNYGFISFSIDGTAQGTRTNTYTRSLNTADIYPFVRIYYATFATSATHTASLNFWNNAGTTTMSDAVIEIIRVA